MEKLAPGPLADALKRGREPYNARFAQARRLSRKLNPEDLAWCLAHLADPIARAVHSVDPARVDSVVEALYDLAVDLLAKDALGPASRHPAINRAWAELGPAAARFLVQEPRLAAAALSNAAYHLAQETGTGLDRWLEDMKRLAPLCPDAAAFLAVGQVIAWRAGLAHFRASAIQVWHRLPEPLGQAALGIDPAASPPPREALIQALADPWQDPAGAGSARKFELALVARVGGFRGFGGPFISPPEVTQTEGTILAFDREYCHALYADAFGAVFKRHGSDLPSRLDQTPGFNLEPSGRVTKGHLSKVFPELAGFTAFAATPTTLAVTLPASHYVFLVAVRPEPSR
jgi:hypothetical protein